jgi:hypothetical protein
LGRWTQAIDALQRAVGTEPNRNEVCTLAVLHLLQVYLLGERPTEAEQLAITLDRKGWLPSAANAVQHNQRLALFKGFQAAAKRMLGKDAGALENQVREAYLKNAVVNELAWSWAEFDNWLSSQAEVRLAPDRKAALEKIVLELKGITVLDDVTALANHASTLLGEDSLDTFPATKNSHRKVHRVTLKAGRSYQIDLTSSDFDTYLRLENSKREPLVYNDDIYYPYDDNSDPAKNLNSRIVFTPAKDDSYRIIVTSYQKGATGRYALKVRPVAKAGTEEVYTGELTRQDAQTQTKKFYRKHTVKLEAGRPYTIVLESAQFDTYLRLYNTAGKLVAYNDDITPGNHQMSRIDFTPPITGNYEIMVSSYGEGQTGAYTLRVQGYAN